MYEKLINGKRKFQSTGQLDRMASATIRKSTSENETPKKKHFTRERTWTPNLIDKTLNPIQNFNNSNFTGSEKEKKFH